ncbi:MAG TPA: UMP kinase [Candidatus Norongarragalinales archaeon]|nr:UMP kinase [Candidatus Norongarragalinales archaeon]
MGIVVVSLGGSLLFREGKFDLAYARKAAESFRALTKQGIKLVIVTGGGKRAREYAQIARKKYGSEFFADREAIHATRENAAGILKAIGEAAFQRILEKFDDADTALEKHDIAVGGGILEGLTTDAVCVLFAEKLKANAVVNLGDTAGVYASDPKKNPDAKRFAKMSHEALLGLAIRGDARKAGTHFVFDLVAAKLAARSNIPLRFVDGRDIGQAEAAIAGKKFQGTSVED